MLILLITFTFIDGKVYKQCELARELVRHGFSKGSLSSWMCLIFSESSYNTLLTNDNVDGSKDYGLFQINDRYWCKTAGKRSKNVCGLNCNGEFIIIDSIYWP